MRCGSGRMVDRWSDRLEWWSWSAGVEWSWLRGMIFWLRRMVDRLSRRVVDWLWILVDWR